MSHLNLSGPWFFQTSCLSWIWHGARKDSDEDHLCYYSHWHFFFSQVLYLLEHLLTTFSCYNLILEKHAQSILLNISTQFKYSNTFKSHRTAQGTYLGQNVKWAPPQLWSSLHSNIGIKQCMPQDQAAEGIQSSSENHAEPLPFFCKFTVDDS